MSNRLALTKTFLFADMDMKPGSFKNIDRDTSDLSTSKALILVFIIFVCSLIALGLLYTQFPEIEE